MILIIFGRAAQFLLALATVRVATTLLSPEEMGRVSLVLATTAFFALFLVNPVGMFINRRLHAWHATGVAKGYLIRYVGYLLLVACVACLMLLLFYQVGVTDFGISLTWLILLVCGSLLFNTVNQTSIPSLNLLGDSKRFVIYSVLTVATSLMFAALLVEMMHPAAQFWLLGLLVGQILLAVMGTWALFSHLGNDTVSLAITRIEQRHLKVLFSFAWPVAIAASLGWVQGQGYRYLMQGSLGLPELGLFVAGYSISLGLIAGFESILTTYFQPRLYRDVHTDDPLIYARVWRRYAAAIIPSLLLTVAVVVVLAPELTRVLLGERFQTASQYVVWGALAEAARVLTGAYSLIAHVYMRTHWLILPNLVGAVLAIGLCVLFMPGFGATGIGMGLVLSGWAVVMVMHGLLVRRIGGGVQLRSVMMAAGAALALWGVAVGLRHWLDATGWMEVVGILLAVGVIYLGLQYLMLRQHLEEKTATAGLHG